MFERFTNQSRQVVLSAEQTARQAGKDRIDSIALLLALLEVDGIASKVLVVAGVDADVVRRAWAVSIPEPFSAAGGAEQKNDRLRFTQLAKKVLESSLYEALSLGCNYIGTEHLLLGLVRTEDSIAARVLLHQGFTSSVEEIRNKVTSPAHRARPPRPPFLFGTAVGSQDKPPRSGDRPQKPSVQRRVRRYVRSARAKYYRRARENGASRVHAAIYAWASAKPLPLRGTR